MKKVLAFVFALACFASMNADEYYLVGGCTDSDWELGAYTRSAVRATQTGQDTWAAAVRLTVGEGDNGRFKIPNGGDDWNSGFFAPAQGTVLTSEWSELSKNGDGDNKFCVAEEGMYLVSFNTSTMKIKADKLTEPAKDGDVFLISNLNDYWYFAAYIATNDTKNAKARLTADLTFDGNFVCLASDKYKFCGEFDGNGHTIDYAVANCAYSQVGLFTYATGKDGNTAHIHDLVIGEHSSFTGTAKVGGIAGFLRDGGEVKLTNVVNKASVTSTGNTDANAAGLIGCATDGTKITALNCANTGTVKGQDGQCAAFAGWTQGGTTFTNCWNIGDINNYESQAQLYRNIGSVTATNCFDLTSKGNQGTKVDASTVSTGEFCYTLNGDQSSIAWYQNLSGDAVDAFPVPFSTHAQVYAKGNLRCDGTKLDDNITYSNEPTTIPPHTNVDGWCTVCGTIDQSYLRDGEGIYNISTAEELYWFAELVGKANQSANAKLTADIDYTAYKQGFIGRSQSLAFRGTFDGQEHTVTIDIVNDDKDRTGLFAYINAATIKNLIVEGSATSAGNNCVGGLGGRSDGDGTLIENVVVKTAVSYTGSNGDATCGGFFANMEGQVTLKNCAFIGSINSGTAEGNGGLVGWAGSGSNNKYINCYVAPVEYTKNGNSAEFARNDPSTTNCYYTSTNDAKLASGELCYLLNAGGDNWYQNLTGDKDAYPVPFSTGHSKVYANAHFDCGGTPMGNVVYGNEDNEVHDPHQVSADGFCTVCNSMIEYIADYMTPAQDGYYEIADNKQMRWFAAFVKNGNADANARLTADIDMTDIKDYEPIGTDDVQYKGTFDGQTHTVTLNLTDDTKNGQGIFGTLTGGATISNLTSAGTIKGAYNVGGIAGLTRGNGDVKFINCGNQAEVTAKNKNAGGILGVDMMSAAKITMTNVYSVGAIKGANENGGLSGWAGDGPNIVNAYSISEVEGSNSSSFIRSNGMNGNNTFGKDQITDEMLASGELCYKLGAAFGQLIGTDNYPVFGSAPVNYVGEAGYATLYDATTGYELNGNAKANVAIITKKDNYKYLDLTEIENVPAGTPVILTGTYYNKISNNSLPEINIANDLKGTDAATEADGTMYVLAKKDDKVGFYKAEGTIPAGKAYIQSPSNVKAFYFDFAGDDATGIENLNNQNTLNTPIYNLAGQRINKMQKGINIVNGKKVLY